MFYRILAYFLQFLKLTLMMAALGMAGNIYCKELDTRKLLPLAGLTVDIFGTNKIDSSTIARKYHEELNTIATLPFSGRHDDPAARRSYNKARKQIISGIRSVVAVKFANINVIRYPNDNIAHLTIDVVEKSDKKRIHYFNKQPVRTIKDPEHLIKNWMEYEKTGMDLIVKEGVFPGVAHCPSWHCFFGFEHPGLQKYEKIFNKAIVEKNKSTLIDILKNDKNENKRKSAAFLLAHANSSNEIIEALIPATRDPSAEVRNNAMRVVATILLDKSQNKNEFQKLLIKKADLVKLAEGLDFPTVTDRNKSLVIVSALIQNQEFAVFIRDHYGNNLLAELKMKQPNVHDSAYYILKKISGKQYAENNYRAWESWLRHHRRA